MLVCGLGNPGDSYVFTRHNIGFLALDQWAERERFAFKKRDALSHHAKTRLGDCSLLLIKPQTYMNESGKAVQKIFSQEGLGADQLIVVQDELDLPFGQIKIKQGGSDGGHRGLISISSSIGPDYFRIRLGIGRGRSGAPDRDRVVDHVLSPFSREEKRQLPDFLDRALLAIELLVEEGLTAAQNRIHTGNSG